MGLLENHISIANATSSFALGATATRTPFPVKETEVIGISVGAF